MTDLCADARFKRLLDSMLEGCQILDFEWRYVYLNDTATAHSRRTREELLGRRYMDLWPGAEKTEVFAHIKAALEERQPHSMENRFQYPDGRTGWFELRISPVPEGVFIMSLDISARKEAEERLRQSEEQHQQMQRMEAIGQLAGGIAHDFNNILVVILGNLELMLEDLPPESPLREDLEEIQRAATRSSELTQQLLGYARRQTVKPQILEANGEIRSTLRYLRRLVGEDIQLSWSPGSNLPLVRIDPVQLNQILTNLCINARDAIANVGKIEISTRSKVVAADEVRATPCASAGEYLLLKVRDTGSGMDAQTMSHVFEPFFTTKALGHGTGLGLATVYGIVRQNGGYICVDSEPGAGTTFSLYLPADKEGGSSRVIPKHTRTQFRSSGQVLLVEDEESILRIIKRMLEQLGFQVLAAPGPEQALERLETSTDVPRLLITDVIMPGMTGPALATRLQERFPQMKTLYISGYTANVIAKRGMLADGIQFLAKPFTREALGEKIREVLDEV